jgi:pimeloyl-ACP methyl ester carboxylesterase
MSDPTTHTLEVPGATLSYDVREPDGDSTAPPLLLSASPMDARGFATLSGYFTDRTVVTYDPRGVARSKRTDGAATSTPEEHGDDLHRVIADLGAGPVDVFASSGGAVNALVLVAQHPEDVRTLVAHEPPAAAALPDRGAALAAVADLHETYQAGGAGPGMAKFMALVSHKGPVPDDFGEHAPTSIPGFGPAEDDGRRDDPLLGQNLITSTTHEHDFAALRAAPTRIVMAAGAGSEGELAHRGALAIAERLGADPAIFPSHHAGFLGGEFGQTGEPEAFAARLREVLDEPA